MDEWCPYVLWMMLLIMPRLIDSLRKLLPLLSDRANDRVIRLVLAASSAPRGKSYHRRSKRRENTRNPIAPRTKGPS